MKSYLLGALSMSLQQLTSHVDAAQQCAHHVNAQLACDRSGATAPETAGTGAGAKRVRRACMVRMAACVLMCGDSLACTLRDGMQTTGLTSAAQCTIQQPDAGLQVGDTRHFCY